jgi:N-acetylneuraminic acid mutarotase
MKKLLPFLLVALCVSSTTFAQYVWQQKASFSAPRYAACGFTIGNFLYFGTGYNNSNSSQSDFWKYDPVLDSWSQVASIATPRISAVSFQINGKGYVGLGYNGSHLTDLNEYNPVTNTWTAKAALPANGRYGAGSFSIGSYGYVVGGNKGSASGPFSSETFAYDAVTNSWSAKAAFPGMARYGIRGGVINNVGYIFGGVNGTGAVGSFYFNDLWKYDPIFDSWNQLTDFPGVGRNYPTVFVIDDLLVAGNGHSATTYFNDFFAFNTVTNTWSPLPSLQSTESRWGAVGSAIGSDAYLTGGNRSITNTPVGLQTHWKLVNTTALNENPNSNNSIHVYPTLATDYIVCEMTVLTDTKQFYEVVDYRGRLIGSGNFEGQIKVDVSGYNSGVYFINIKGENKMIGSKKFVVL